MNDDSDGYDDNNYDDDKKVQEYSEVKEEADKYLVAHEKEVDVIKGNDDINHQVWNQKETKLLLIITNYVMILFWLNSV